VAERIDPDAVRALWTAVLARAVDDYLYAGKNRESRAHKKDAKAWMAAKGYTGVGSFTYVCQAIDLEPDAVIDRLRKKDDDG
jgi:hypothetical protein